MSNYRTDETQLAEMFKALANPHRVRVFMRLLSCCEPGTVCAIDNAQASCVGDLGAELEIAPSTVSHHIKELHRAGLIQLQRRGRHIDCQVNPDAVSVLAAFFDPGAATRRSTTRRRST